MVSFKEDNKNFSLGPRILEKEEMNIVFPKWDEIETQINEIIEIAKSKRKLYGTLYEDCDKELRRGYNNIFSIIGGRGTGKTSLILSLNYKLREMFKEHIHLNLMVPEKMDDSTDVLGRILGFFGEVVEDLENSNNRNMFTENSFLNTCENNKKPLLRSKYEELLKQHRYTKKDYKNFILEQYTGFDEYIQMAKNILDCDYKLLTKFEDFIEELIISKNNIPNIHNEYLIFIYIDDLDFITDKSTDIINVLLRFLSHSNIVVFTAYDYERLVLEYKLNLMKKDNINKRFIGNYEELIFQREKLTNEILKKVFPPVKRVFMQKMNETQKSEFIYYPLIKEAKNRTLYDLISDKLIKYDKKYNFLHYNRKKILSYFKIFDDSRRGTMYAYYFLVKGFNKDFDIKEFKEFIDILIKSSNILNEFEKVIYENIYISDDIHSGVDNSWIDYEWISNKVNVKKNFDKAFTVYLFFNFIENILKYNLFGKSLNVKAGRDILFDLLKVHNKYLKKNKKKENFIIYPNINNNKFLLQLNSYLNESFPSTDMAKVNKNSKGFEFKYFNILVKLIPNDKLYIDFFRELYFKDKKWTIHKLKLIKKHVNRAEAIFAKNLRILIKILYNDKNVVKEFEIEFKNHKYRKNLKEINELFRKIEMDFVLIYKKSRDILVNNIEKQDEDFISNTVFNLEETKDFIKKYQNENIEKSYSNLKSEYCRFKEELLVESCMKISNEKFKNISDFIDFYEDKVIHVEHNFIDINKNEKIKSVLSEAEIDKILRYLLLKTIKELDNLELFETENVFYKINTRLTRCEADKSSFNKYIIKFLNFE